jgi:hypothetical protein
MRLVALLLGTLAVCAAGVVFSVYDYARHGSSTPAYSRAQSVQAAADSTASVPSGPAATAGPALTGLPEDAAGATGPVALPPQQQPPDEEDAAPPPDEPRAKDHHRVHGKHDQGGGGG